MRYQGAPAGTAQELPREFLLQQGLEDCAPGLQLVPPHRRLAMGHVHAVFVLMVINKQAIRNVAAAFSD